MTSAELAASIQAADPAVGLRAVGALHRLAERVEAIHVRRAGEATAALAPTTSCSACFTIRPPRPPAPSASTWRRPAPHKTPWIERRWPPSASTPATSGPLGNPEALTGALP